MRNFVLIYKISDADSENNFIKSLKKEFPRNKIITEDKLTYFGFAARQLPEIKDRLQGNLKNLIFSQGDYISLFYTRPAEPDEINQWMIIGYAETIKNDLLNRKIGMENLDRNIIELLEFDFIKNKMLI